MSRKGDCWDNAPMESFFGTLKTECLLHYKFKTRDEANRVTFEYIEVFYNRMSQTCENKQSNTCTIRSGLADTAT
jgi:putative transposase